MGLAAPLMFQALQAAFSSETPAEVPYWDGLLLVYGGLFLTFLFACLFGINMYVWAKARINYKFIFEFDPRDNLDYHEYFEVSEYTKIGSFQIRTKLRKLFSLLYHSPPPTFAA